MKPRLLSGDRITGKLHLGHYVGSLKKRVELQHKYDCFVLLADVQALTTHYEKPEIVSENLRNVAMDYLACGIDPNQSTLYIQSMIPEIAELTVYFSMFVTVNSLRHNPTIKSEATERGYTQMYYGFLGYPVSQAADIAICKAELIPVGEDQLPHIEQTCKIIRRFHQLYAPVFPEPQALISETPRLLGLDGSSKMSKGLNNAILLDSTCDEVSEKIQRAKTDPARIQKHDPGHPEICTVYSYHQAFSPELASEIYDSCSQGTIGCKDCKKKIADRINALLDPMRDRRDTFSRNAKYVDEILIAGTQRARSAAKETMQEVREAMKINYFS
ncbi:tryptophan--tRNA ligase [Paenibacillus radicis (ex Xue et al. 2023)]|uniref:Tryptophan--tRNA ligase n=1 Tax=Paenibacillus radicis (ex Xue et al. 2023) TaxID=2972489 RepID=A0ABT1YGB2_9BACL|nr:tryptophan--tRNA ligase [Paenibacillus radicis (ex Xue et al. 2023)]MCR8631760.1 tryptophan--tRNA ligase [Paenibacillus radicis (ex Xue et al. 2023)]